ncbi:MAG: haloacid dehalogenase [Actinomycetales bacterium]|nr:MAG: haloacid dehalogenase [Actinomycetales bacterium]
MTPSAAVRAVIFDWGGTITPWHTVDHREQWTVFARGMGAVACGLNDTATTVQRVEEDAWRRGRQEGVSARLGEILAAVGLDPAYAATQAGLAAYHDFWEPHTFTHPVIPGLWKDLREKGIRIGVLSNTIWSREHHRGFFERDGVLDLIDGDVYSSETPWVKPRPEIFLAAAASLGVEPQHCIYVGDRSYEDVHGPQSVGMRAIWIPHSDIPQEQQVSHEATPDAIAHELIDIVTIVQAWSLDHSRPKPE